LSLDNNTLTKQDPALPGSAIAPRPSRLRWPQSFDPLAIVGILMLVALWYVLAPIVPHSALPPLHSVVQTMFEKFWFHRTFAFYGLVDTGFFSALIYTIENVLMAVVLGGFIGIVAGLVTARSSLARAAIDPIALTLGTVPILIASPFLLLWLGGDRSSAVAMVGFYVAVMLYTYAQRAADNLDPVYESAARTYGASRGRILRNILIPGTLPEILGGIRIALAGAWGLEAIAELLASQRGLGKLIESISASSDIKTLLAALLLLGLTAALFDMIVALIFSQLTRWRHTARLAVSPR